MDHPVLQWPEPSCSPDIVTFWQGFKQREVTVFEWKIEGRPHNLVICCGDQYFNVHEEMIDMHSQILASLRAHPTATERQLIAQETSPLFHQLFHFIYYGEVPLVKDWDFEAELESDFVTTMTELYRLGNQYRVRGLMDYLCCKLTQYLGVQGIAREVMDKLAFSESCSVWRTHTSTSESFARILAPEYPAPRKISDDFMSGWYAATDKKSAKIVDAETSSTGLTSSPVATPMTADELDGAKDHLYRTGFSKPMAEGISEANKAGVFPNLDTVFRPKTNRISYSSATEMTAATPIVGDNTKYCTDSTKKNPRSKAKSKARMEDKQPSRRQRTDEMSKQLQEGELPASEELKFNHSLRSADLPKCPGHAIHAFQRSLQYPHSHTHPTACVETQIAAHQALNAALSKKQVVTTHPWKHSNNVNVVKDAVKGNS